MRTTWMLVGLFGMSLSCVAEHIVFVGHSLVNHNMPRMLAEMASARHPDVKVEAQIINGAPLKFNWENAHEAEGVNARKVLAKGGVDALVLAEAVPLQNHLTWSDTHGVAVQWAKHARTHNPGIRIYIYETWHCTKSGTPEGCAYDELDDLSWRARLDRAAPKWQGIVDAINAEIDAPPARLVPAGQVMAKLHDAAGKGRIEGLSSAMDLFSDDIHMNNRGNAVVAMIHYAVLFGKSPEGLPYALENEWGQPFEALTEAQAGILQKGIWRSLQGIKKAPTVQGAP